MEKTKYPGHDEATKAPPSPPQGYNSPGTHADLNPEPQGVNAKTELGKTGKS